MTSSITPKHQAIADSLQREKGDQYRHQCYQDVIAHQWEGIAIIDSLLLRLHSDSLWKVASTMRADQEREIDEFSRKAGAS